MSATRSAVPTRHPLLDRLAEARVRTDEVFDLVRPDALYDRPIPERHRINFYIGHLEAFDANLLRDRVQGLEPFHPEFDKLFAFGIDPVGGGLPSDQPSDWPTIADTRAYAERIRRSLDNGLSDLELDSDLDEAADADSARHKEFPTSTLLNVAIEHRLMHAETLTYMLHQLPLERKVHQSGRPKLVLAPYIPGMVGIPSGSATLGMPRGVGGTFGWDNEFEESVVNVPAFEIDKYKVTNSQFLEFVAAGGYDDRAFWREADWEWKTAHNISHPVFWSKAGKSWLYRGMFDEISLPLDWPVYASHAEASAYARWAGKELPTEAQWHRAAYGTPHGAERPYPWGSAEPAPKLGNFDFHRWNPTPVAAYPDSKSAFGVEDMLGNGWEWTSTLFGPFAGFQPFPFYKGYSADFFDGKHFVMKGGSTRTAASMLRRTFRNWFQPNYQYVYAGFRCVRN